MSNHTSTRTLAALSINCVHPVAVHLDILSYYPVYTSVSFMERLKLSKLCSCVCSVRDVRMSSRLRTTHYYPVYNKNKMHISKKKKESPATPLFFTLVAVSEATPKGISFTS